MTHSKINFRTYVTSHLALLLMALFFLSIESLNAQEENRFRLSLGATAGYAPLVTMGNDKNSGIVLGAFGDLEYGPIIGRLQFTKALKNTFSDDDNQDGGEAYHGSLGYRLDVNEKLSIGLLLSGGATIVRYITSFNGSRGDEFTNVSPQVGGIISPVYKISEPLSIQAALRYYKGFEAGDRGLASDLADFSVGLRVSF